MSVRSITVFFLFLLAALSCTQEQGKTRSYDSINDIWQCYTYGCPGIGETGSSGPVVLDAPDTCSQAESLALNGSKTETLLSTSDHDYFKVTVPSAGTLRVYSEGATNTRGDLLQSCSVILSDADSGVANNFDIATTVTTGQYEIRVRSDSGGTGSYQIYIHFSAVPVQNPAIPQTMNYSEALSAYLLDTSDRDPAMVYSLRYGPAGMSITADGQLQWNSGNRPLFDKETDFNWGAQVDYGGATYAYNGTITLIDSSRQRPLVRTEIQAPIHDESLFIEDLNNDGKNELLVNSGSILYELEEVGGEYRQKWVYPFALSSTAIDIADTNGDSKPEFFLSLSASRLIKIDGASRRIVQSVAIDDSCVDIDIADINNDALLEVVCLQHVYSNKIISVFRASDLSLLWQTAELDLGRSIAVGNIDGDLALEIVTSNGFVFDGITQGFQWQYVQGFGDKVVVGDLNNNGRDEIVGFDAWKWIKVYDGLTETEISSYSFSGDIDTLTVANIDGDGEFEILMGQGQHGDIFAYDFTAGSLVQKWILDNPAHGCASLAAGDVNNDGQIEIAWSANITSTAYDALFIADHTSSMIEWTNLNIKNLTGPFMGARFANLGNGGTLFFGSSGNALDDDNSQFVSFNPITAELLVSENLGYSREVSSVVELVDYGTANARIFLNTSERNGAVYPGRFLLSELNMTGIQFGSPPDIGHPMATSLIDFNNDGRQDLAYLNRDNMRLEVFDFISQGKIFSSQALPSNPRDFEVTDVDNDGDIDFVISALNPSKIMIIKKESIGYSYQEASFVGHGYPNGPLTAVSILNDDKPEIVVAFGTRVLILDIANLSIISEFETGSEYINDFKVISGDRPVLIGGTYYQSSKLVEYDLLTGVQIWHSPSFVGSIGLNSLNFVDLNNDGVNEIAIGTSDAMIITR